MGRLVLPAIFLAAMVVAAGCLSKDEGAPGQTASAAETGPESTAAALSSNGTENANTTASGNSTKASADAPSNPGNCMRGMDMPGCTQAQADAYFDARRVNAPPPDKPLDPITIVLDAQGANAEGAFTLDNGTMLLLVEIIISDLGQGPYAALGPEGGELKLNFVGPVETTTLSLGGAYVGVDPANALEKKSTATLQMPAIGDWTVSVEGQGANVEVEIRLVERFSM